MKQGEYYSQKYVNLSKSQKARDLNVLLVHIKLGSTGMLF